MIRTIGKIIGIGSSVFLCMEIIALIAMSMDDEWVLDTNH